MKVAILSVSEKGYDLSLKIKNELDNDLICYFMNMMQSLLLWLLAY